MFNRSAQLVEEAKQESKVRKGQHQRVEKGLEKGVTLPRHKGVMFPFKATPKFTHSLPFQSITLIFLFSPKFLQHVYTKLKD